MSTDPTVLAQVNDARSGTDIPPAPQEVGWSLTVQPAVSLESVAVAYVIVLHSLAETLFEHTFLVGDDADSLASTRRRREICAAVWAANHAALETSNLSESERARMNDLVWRRLQVHWQTFCGSTGEGSAWLARRASEYLDSQPRGNAIAVAAHIVRILFEAIGVKQDSFPGQSRVIASLIGHRIMSEVNHLNELKSKFRFV